MARVAARRTGSAHHLITTSRCAGPTKPIRRRPLPSDAPAANTQPPIWTAPSHFSRQATRSGSTASSCWAGSSARRVMRAMAKRFGGRSRAANTVRSISDFISPKACCGRFRSRRRRRSSSAGRAMSQPRPTRIRHCATTDRRSSERSKQNDLCRGARVERTRDRSGHLGTAGGVRRCADPCRKGTRRDCSNPGSDQRPPVAGVL
jgi:hypothetical protein